MGRRNWRRKQVTVHEVEEVTITRKKRKTYVLEDPAIEDQPKKTKKQKPPLITNFDYGVSRTKQADDDDDSDFARHGENAYEEEKEQNKENDVALNYKKVHEFRCNSFTIRYVFCKTREAHFFNAVDVIQCIRESRPYSGVSRIIQPMLKVDLNRYLVATGKTKVYLSQYQLQEITEHYLTMTYRSKKDKINKINKLRKQAARIATKKKSASLENATEITDYPIEQEQHEREVIHIEDFSSDDEEVEMAPTVSGLFLIPAGLSKRFLKFKNNQILEYIVYDGRTLYKSSDLFLFLFSKDANANTRDKLCSLFSEVAENVLFVHYRDSEEEVYFTTLQTLCILNHFLCQEIYQSLKSIFNRIMLLKINIVNHSEKVTAEVPM